MNRNRTQNDFMIHQVQLIKEQKNLLLRQRALGMPGDTTQNMGFSAQLQGK